MSTRLNNVMNGNTFSTHGEGQAPRQDLSIGGMGGFSPDWQQIVGQSGYRPRDIIPILMEAPVGYKYFPDPQRRFNTLKSLVETQFQSVQGLTHGATNEYSEIQVGRSGQLIHDVNRTIITQPEVTFNYRERANAAIHRFFYEETTLLGFDPHTQQIGIVPYIQDTSTIASEAAQNTFGSSVVLYILPDVTRTKVVWAWLALNVTFETSGELESQADVTAALDVPELAIPTKATYDQSEGTRVLAQRMLDNMPYFNAGPNQRPAFVQNVAANLTADDKGYVEELRKEAAKSL